MFVHVQVNSNTPIYAQIMEQVKHAIASNIIREGEKLPSVRSMAEQICVNPNTVAKAYRELEHEGLVKTQRGKGMFVCKVKNKLTQVEKERIVGEKIDGALVEALNLGLSTKEVKKVIQDRSEKFYPDLSV